MVASMWAFMASWFTPTILFCVLNLMIGTIFITSTSKSQNKRRQQLGVDDSPQLVRTPSLLDRVRSFNFSFHRSESDHPYPFPPETHHTDPPDPQTQMGLHGQNPTEVSEFSEHHVTRSRSETCGEAPASIPAKMMKKSASEKSVVKSSKEEDEVVKRRGPATVREKKGARVSETASFAEDEGVDAKADDFINRFKQQLKLQRLDSILRYKEMLNRGAGK